MMKKVATLTLLAGAVIFAGVTHARAQETETETRQASRKS